MVKVPGALRLLLVVSLVVTGSVVATAPAGAAPGLTVTPATGLLDQQIVTVTGAGFTAGTRLLVTQCAGAAPDGCAIDPPVNTVGAYGTVADDGTVRATLRLSRVLALEEGDTSCADDTCSIAVLARDEALAELARTGIDFAATGTAPPTPDAALSLAFPGGIRPKGGQATWTGSGLLPWFHAVRVDFDVLNPPISVHDIVGPAEPAAYVALCTAPPAGWGGCERFTGPPQFAPGLGPFRFHQTVPVTGAGTVSTSQHVPRMWDSDAGRIDCAVEDCAIALDQDPAHSVLADVAWAPEWAPYPSGAAFVTAAYRALIGRAPTASERSTAVAALTDRSLTGFALLRQLAARADGRRMAEISRLYLAALGRRPDGSGLAYWADELARTGSISGIAVAFGRSPEFRQVFGSVSDERAVELAYQRTLGRNPAASERSYWVGRLRAGLARTHMIHHFSRAPEFVGREGGRSEATAITVALLRRAPTNDEWTLAGPGILRFDSRTLTQRADDAVLVVLSSNQLTAEVG